MTQHARQLDPIVPFLTTQTHSFHFFMHPGNQKPGSGTKKETGEERQAFYFTFGMNDLGLWLSRWST
jgi:hypothetical protein